MLQLAPSFPPPHLERTWRLQKYELFPFRNLAERDLVIVPHGGPPFVTKRLELCALRAPTLKSNKSTRRDYDPQFSIMRRIVTVASPPFPLVSISNQTKLMVKSPVRSQ